MIQPRAARKLKTKVLDNTGSLYFPHFPGSSGVGGRVGSLDTKLSEPRGAEVSF